MAKFAWEGTTREGQFKKGFIDASSSAEAESKLRSMQVQVSKVGRAWGQIEINIPRMGGVKTKTLVVKTPAKHKTVLVLMASGIIGVSLEASL